MARTRASWFSRTLTAILAVCASGLLVNGGGLAAPAPVARAAEVGPVTLMTPTRVLDTRPSSAGVVTTGVDAATGTPIAAGQIQANTTRRFRIAGQTFPQGTGTFPFPAGIYGVLVNVTEVGPPGGGFLTVFPGNVADANRPLASTLNPVAGINYNFAVVGTDPNPASGAGFGSIAVYTTATVDVVVDVYGYFTAPVGPGNGWNLAGNAGTNPATNFIGTTDIQPLVVRANNAEALRVLANGNLGVGATAPASKLHVVSPAGALPPRLQSEGTNTAAAGWDFYHGTTGKGYVGVPDSGFAIGPGEMVVYGSQGVKTSLWANGERLVTAGTNGTVGVGEPNPGANTRLQVRGKGSTSSTFSFVAENTDGLPTLSVRDNGLVYIGALGEPSTRHACLNLTGGLPTTYYFSACSSAAEYVPTVDGAAGYPETADLVSIVPGVANPYGDEHSPFVVEKAPAACDPNLLGFVLKPELGADGPKLNEHYRPLGIFGYFPAKVTTENGAIKRGDPITSSSTPGVGMKSTGACRTVGYALEDAAEDGTIQVFAHLGESTAPTVAEVQGRLSRLEERYSALEARLAAIEAGVGRGRRPAPPVESSTPWGWQLLAGLGVVGAVVGPRVRSRRP